MALAVWTGAWLTHQKSQVQVLGQSLHGLTLRAAVPNCAYSENQIDSGTVSNTCFMDLSGDLLFYLFGGSIYCKACDVEK